MTNPCGYAHSLPADTSRMPVKKVWIGKAVAICFGLAAGLVIAEVLLRAVGIPYFYKAHSDTPRFKFLQDSESGKFFYVNMPSTSITFQYDSNPRGYFEPGNIVHHATNGAGFRGPEFSVAKSAGTIRLLFLGDSLTFGEGVRFEDTFAEVSRSLLAERFGRKKLAFESQNLGVGGYNTANELFLLKAVGLQLRPDVVVLCYDLNDAEPALYEVDPVRGVMRRSREAQIPEGLSEPTPPETPLYQLRTAQLVWRAAKARERSRQTEAYYHSLYAPDAKGWKTTRDALHEMAAICRREKVPLIVMLFPFLHKLDAHYPFRDIHAMVAQEAETGGALVLDLLPAFQGSTAAQLWVHPTDQHPNERAHRIAAELLAETLATRREFLAKIGQPARDP